MNRMVLFKSMAILFLTSSFLLTSGEISMYGVKINDSQKSLENVNLERIAKEEKMQKFRTENGNDFSITVDKGKVVYIDFWASWCGPCRQENPNVVAAYNKFKDKNFTILGVSLDNDKEAWIKAIKNDGLNWKQVSDLKQWESSMVPLYGFDGIPFNVLIDPSGKIIASSLRGEDLEKTLAAILK